VAVLLLGGLGPLMNVPAISEIDGWAGPTIFSGPLINGPYWCISQNIAALGKVLQWLLDEKSWLKASKCHFFTKRLDILVHILTSGRFHMDLKKRKKELDFKVSSNRLALRGILSIVIFLCQFCPDLASWSGTLSELQGKNAPWRWTDTHTRGLAKIKEFVNSPQTSNHSTTSQNR